MALTDSGEGEVFIPYFWVARRCKHIRTVFGFVYFLSKFLNVSFSIISEYKLLTIVASSVFFNGLPNWTLSLYPQRS